MNEPTCFRCARPLADGSYCCDRCAAQTAQKLAEIAEVAPAARDVANGLSRSSQGGATGKPGSRLPLDLTAMAKLDGVQNTLTGWARLVAEERGRGIPVAYAPDDQVVRCANWLTEQVEWIRHRDFADEFLTDVEACRRIVRGIVRGPADQRYLGPCGADVVRAEIVGDQWESEIVACDGDVYVRGDARTGRCKTCGAEVDRGDREAWLDGEVREHAFTAREIADAYGINVKTIRSWHERGQLAQHGSDRDGRPLHNVGDVLDLAAADAARRETNRAERARRVAARAADDERLSA